MTNGVGNNDSAADLKIHLISKLLDSCSLLICRSAKLMTMNPNGAGNLTAFVVTFTVALAIYLQTVAPSIVGGDSGELVAEGCMLGTAHPPSYPLFIILVNIVTRLGSMYGPSDASPAFFVNVLCSEGLLFAFSPLTWQYSITAEVFALHNFFVALIVHTAVRYDAAPTKRLLYLGSFVCGLALANQHTAILLETPIVLWVVYKSNLVHHKELLLKTTLFFLAGLVPYGTVPIFASLFPHQGSWGDVTSFRGFIHHLLRRDYGTLQLYSGDSSDAEAMLERTLHWLVNLGSEQSANNPVIFAFFLVGCSSMLPQDSRARETTSITGRRVIVASLMFYIVVFHSLANLPLSNPLHFAIHSRFWMHPNLLAFVAIGIGMSKLSSTYVRRSKKKAQCLAVMMALMPMHSAKRGFKYSDESSNVHFDNYARSVLEPLPRDSLLLINWDQQWTSIRYLQECEGFRDDITSINLSMMSYPWFGSKHSLYEGITFPGTHYTPRSGSGFTFSQFVDANYGAFAKRIFVGGSLSYPDATFDQAYELLPFGMVNQVVANDGDGPDFEDYQHRTKGVWKQVFRSYHASGLPDATRYTERTWEHTIARMVYDSLYSRATTLLDMSIKNEGFDRHILPS
eukprot:CAMPEP_0178668532 /NCGR_PEP_ID=MMETSP0698-20121128/31632_1 /TAXON_ID=265572 /ORGANISM="Extubocellulus spinifer, Strain CCMP396" /LENGTH=625 /DNA_ID=CAMNT_0020312109 /DNA_START=809 /DNA_END=2683 /DNA_ORIENTATION=+